MIRLAFIVIFLALLSFGVDWLLTHNGSITIEWLGYRITTSVAFIVVGVSVLFIIFGLMITTWVGIRLWTNSLGQKHAVRSMEKGVGALREGFVALSAGQYDKAAKAGKRATKLLDGEPLAVMVHAQACQLQGNGAQAKQLFESLVEDKDSRSLGVKGLLTYFTAEDDIDSAIALMENTHEEHPDSEELVLNLYDLYKRAMRWEDAQALLEKRKYKKLFASRFVTTQDKKREHAVLIYLQSREAFMQQNYSTALDLAEKAKRIYAAFSPGVFWLARAANALDKPEKALKAIEAQWKVNPRPFLGEIYCDIVAKHFPKRLSKRVQKLASLKKNNPYSQLVIAKAALMDKAPEVAKNHLKVLITEQEMTRAYHMLVEAEKMEETPDITRLQAWQEKAVTAPPDPAWQCSNCSFTTYNWEYHCKQCGQMDSFSWTDTPAIRAEKTTLNAIDTDSDVAA